MLLLDVNIVLNCRENVVLDLELQIQLHFHKPILLQLVSDMKPNCFEGPKFDASIADFQDLRPSTPHRLSRSTSVLSPSSRDQRSTQDLSAYVRRVHPGRPEDQPHPGQRPVQQPAETHHFDTSGAQSLLGLIFLLMLFIQPLSWGVSLLVKLLSSPFSVVWYPNYYTKLLYKT